MNYKTILTLCAVVASLTAEAASAQCTVGVNQPSAFTSSGNPVAWPRAGARWLDSYPKPMDSRGIMYVLCGTSLNARCWTGPGDYNFTSSQGNTIRQSFNNWSAARTSNNSGLSFWEGAATDASSYFYIDVKRLDDIAMLGDAGVTHQNWGSMDLNGDGVHDAWRVVSAITELNASISSSQYLAFLGAHEIGHTMALYNCTTCTIYTTVMSSEQYSFNSTDASMPTSPTFCDNDQSKQTAFP